MLTDVPSSGLERRSEHEDQRAAKDAPPSSVAVGEVAGEGTRKEGACEGNAEQKSLRHERRSVQEAREGSKQLTEK